MYIVTGLTVIPEWMKAASCWHVIPTIEKVEKQNHPPMPLEREVLGTNATEIFEAPTIVRFALMLLSPPSAWEMLQQEQPSVNLNNRYMLHMHARHIDLLAEREIPSDVQQGLRLPSGSCIGTAPKTH